MALHTDLPIYRTGVRLLDLAVRAQVQMPRTVKRALGEKITQHCVEMLDLMALANATQREARAAHIDQLMSIAMEPTPPNAEALIGVIATHFKVSDELAAEWLDSADFTPYY